MGTTSNNKQGRISHVVVKAAATDGGLSCVAIEAAPSLERFWCSDGNCSEGSNGDSKKSREAVEHCG